MNPGIDKKCLKTALTKKENRPFKEVCYHRGQVSNDHWLPYYSSKIMGETLLDIATNHPDIDYLVLCGHSHSEAFYQPLNNLKVRTGRAEYYFPEIQDIICIEPAK